MMRSGNCENRQQLDAQICFSNMIHFGKMVWLILCILKPLSLSGFPNGIEVLIYQINISTYCIGKYFRFMNDVYCEASINFNLISQIDP